MTAYEVDDLVCQLGPAHDQVRKRDVLLVVLQLRAVDTGAEQSGGACHRHGSGIVPLVLTTSVDVGVSDVASHREDLHARRPHGHQVRADLLGERLNEGRWTGSGHRDSRSGRCAGGYDRRGAGVESFTERRLGDRTGHQFAVLPEGDMHGPVVARRLGELSGAVERVHDPDPAGGQSGCRVCAALQGLLGQYGVFGTLLSQQSHQEFVSGTITGVLERLALEALFANREQLSAGGGRQPRGQLMIIGDDGIGHIEESPTARPERRRHPQPILGSGPVGVCKDARVSNAPSPLLVTGVPRSGTTWLARLLASAPGTAMIGREPMNPRARQYALAGTLTAWTRLELPTPRQRRALQTTYQGLNPRTYGRYGRNQRRGPLPGTRIVVKDPFAMLSVPAITSVTGARGVQLYRHPGAVLASYRRMGWRGDVEEMAPFMAAATGAGDAVAELWESDRAQLSDTDAMGLFWSILTTLALDDMARTPSTVMVAHRELAAGGLPATTRLFSALGLEVSESTRAALNQGGESQHNERELHRFDRNPAEVAEAWTSQVSGEDVARIEFVTAPVRARVEQNRLRLLDQA